MNKLKVLAASFGAGVVGLLGVAAAHADTINAGDLTVPTSTVHDLLASVSNIFTDPGILALLVVAVAIPLAFYVAHQVIGLISRRTRRS